jgi:hypothetical protein
MVRWRTSSDLAMSHENALLLDSLYGHEPHRRALHRFANCFGI